MISFEPLPEFKPRFSVVGCYLESNGQLLYLKRSPAKEEPNTWTNPGGKISDGETEEQAVVREVMEETGIALDPSALTFRFRAWVRYPTYDFHYAAYSCAMPQRPDVMLNPESQDYRWVTPAEALALPLIEDEDVCVKHCYGLE